MKRSVQAEIAGQTLAIKSDEGPEYVRELAEFVDAQIRELSAGRRTTVNMQRVALLAALVNRVTYHVAPAAVALLVGAPLLRAARRRGSLPEDAAPPSGETPQDESPPTNETPPPP